MCFRFIYGYNRNEHWLKLDDVLWTKILLVFLEQTKLLLPAFPVGSQENRELYILLLFSNMQWKYGTKPSQSSSANLAQGTGSPVLLRRNFDQSNVAGNECFCYKAFRLRFALWDAVFFLPLLCRLPTFREMRPGMNSCMEFFLEKHLRKEVRKWGERHTWWWGV